MEFTRITVINYGPILHFFWPIDEVDYPTLLTVAKPVGVDELVGLVKTAVIDLFHDPWKLDRPPRVGIGDRMVSVGLDNGHVLRRRITLWPDSKIHTDVWRFGVSQRDKRRAVKELLERIPGGVSWALGRLTWPARKPDVTGAMMRIKELRGEHVNGEQEIWRLAGLEAVIERRERWERALLPPVKEAFGE